MTIEDPKRKLFTDGPSAEELIEPGSVWSIPGDIVGEYLELAENITRNDWKRAERIAERHGNRMAMRCDAIAVTGAPVPITSDEVPAYEYGGTPYYVTSRSDLIDENFGLPHTLPWEAYAIHQDITSRIAQRIQGQKAAQVQRASVFPLCPVCGEATYKGSNQPCPECQQVIDAIKVETLMTERVGKNTRREAAATWIKQQ